MREPGFYWVSDSGEWFVAEWTGGNWWFDGLRHGSLDLCWQEIDETRITRGNGLLGKPVRKIGGSFQHHGEVVAEFTTRAGEPRIVLEFAEPVAGMLHVYRPDQVEVIPQPPKEPEPPQVRILRGDRP